MTTEETDCCRSDFHDGSRNLKKAAMEGQGATRRISRGFRPNSLPCAKPLSGLSPTRASTRTKTVTVHPHILTFPRSLLMDFLHSNTHMINLCFLHDMSECGRHSSDDVLWHRTWFHRRDAMVSANMSRSFDLETHHCCVKFFLCFFFLPQNF